MNDEFVILRHSGSTGSFQFNYDDLNLSYSDTLRLLPVYDYTTFKLKVVENSGKATAFISGAPKVGNTLYASFASTDPDGMDYATVVSFLWQRKVGDAWVDLPNATQSYKLTNQDAFYAIRAVLTYTDDDGFRETVTSVPVAISYPEPSSAFLIAPSGFYNNGRAPSAMAVHADGSILVVAQDSQRIYIHRYSSRGILEWTQDFRVSDDGWSNVVTGRPVSVAIGDNQEIFITTSVNYSLNNVWRTTPLVLSYSQQGVFQWSKYLDNELGSRTLASGIASGGARDLYVVGSFITSYQQGANFARLDANGHSLGAVGLEVYGNARAITVDDDGYVYNVGSSYLPWDWKSYVTKHNSQGEQQWIRYFGAGGIGFMGASSPDQANAVVVSKSGNIFVGGYTEWLIDNFSFDRQTAWPIREGSGGFNYNKDAFVASFSPTGDLIWGTQFGTMGDEEVISLVASSDGGVYAAGYTGDQTYWTYSKSHEIFVRRYEANGTLSWNRFFGAPRNAYVKDLEIEPSGSLVLLGATTGNLTDLSSADSPDYYFHDDFLLRLNPDGSDGAPFDFANPIAVELVGQLRDVDFSQSLKRDVEQYVINLFKNSTPFHILRTSRLGASRIQDGSGSYLKIQGKLEIVPIAQLSWFLDDFLEVDLSGDNYIKVSTDSTGNHRFDVIGKFSTSRDIQVAPDLTLKSTSIYLDSTKEKFKFDTTLGLFGRLDIIAGFGLIGNEIDYIEVGVDNLNLPIGATAPGSPYLQRLSTSIDNISDRGQALQFDGDIGFTIGPQKKVPLPANWLLGSDISLSLVRADVTGSFTKNEISASGDVKILSGLARGNAKVDWNFAGNLEITGSLSVLDGFITIGDGNKIFIDSSLSIYAFFDGVKINWPAWLSNKPSWLPSGSLPFDQQGRGQIVFSNDNDFSNDYVWAGFAFDLDWDIDTKPFQVGVKIGFDRSVSFPKNPGLQPEFVSSSLSQAQLLRLETGLFATSLGAAEADTSFGQSEDFAVAPLTDWVIFQSSWELASTDAQLKLISPDGTEFTESTWSAAQFKIVDFLTSSTSRAVAVLRPDAGSWQFDVQSSTGLGAIFFETFRDSFSPVITVDSVTSGIDAGTYSIEFTGSDADSDAEISLFYSSSAIGGNDAKAIVLGLAENDSSSVFTWNTEGVAPGSYYVYAQIFDGINSPVRSYWSDPVVVAGSVDLLAEVVASSSEARPGSILEYTVNVSNSGPSMATSVGLVFTKPSASVLVDADVPVQSLEGDQLTFSVGDVDVGSASSISIRIQVPSDVSQPEDLVASARLFSKAFDSNQFNNFVSVNTRVVGEVIPFIDSILDDQGPVQGPIVDLSATDDLRPLIAGSLSSALNDRETVLVLDGGSPLGLAQVVGLTWSYSPSLELGRNYKIFARVANAAGFLGPASSYTGFSTINIGDAAFSITGTPAVGQVLTASNTAADPDGNGSFSYAWQSFNGSSWSAIGTDASTYTLSAAEEGKQVRVRVSYTDSHGFAEAVTADAVSVPFVDNGDAAFSITGTALIGQTLTAVKTADDPDGNGSFSYAWQFFNGRTWDPIVSNSSSYFVTAVDQGKRLRVLVTYSDAQGFAESVSTSILIPRIARISTIDSVVDDEGLLQGSLASGRRSDDRTPTISGRLSTPLDIGQSLQIYSGNTLLGVVSTINDDGSWSYAPTLPASDLTIYSFRARVADAAGNLGPASASYRLLLDTSAPLTTASISGVFDNLGLIQGEIAADVPTDDRTPTFTGTLSGPLASDERLQLFNGTELLGSARVNSEDLSWSFRPLLPETAGTSYTITARVVDGAGNLGPASAGLSFVSDSTAPSTTAVITSVADDEGWMQGPLASGRRSDDRNPTISGTISAPLAEGESLMVFDSSSLLGVVTEIEADGTWRYTPTLAESDGRIVRFRARVVDAAGNRGPVSPPHLYVLDTTSPLITVSITEVFDNVGLSRGPIPADGRTDDRTPTFTGTLSGPLAADERLQLFNGSDLLGTARVNSAEGTWRFTPTLPASEGTPYTITARVVDGAGNFGPASSSVSFVLDTSPNPITGTPGDDSLALTAARDRLTGLGGSDTIVLSRLSHSLLGIPTAPAFDQITDLVTGQDRIDAPVARTLAQALTPVALGSVPDLSAGSIAALLTATSFPALTTTSIGGAATFSYLDPLAGTRTFLAISNGVAGYSASGDSILEITGYSGDLADLRVF